VAGIGRRSYDVAMAPTRTSPFSPTVACSAPWAKLCGVRDVATAAALAELGPDAIGLNFYPRSARYVAPEVAAEIGRVLPAEVAAVGVFVNSGVDEILRTVDAASLAAVQLHGDEPPEAVAELKRRRDGLAVIRAWRVGEEGLADLAGYLAACETLGVQPDAILVDAKVSGAYGGTGHTAPWHRLREYRRDWPPLILAGGLTPANVAEAVAAVRPWGVDTAGGVESAPGVKDAGLAAAFLARVRTGSHGTHG